MAIRFASFERISFPTSGDVFADEIEYKDLMTGTDGKISSGGTFIGTSFFPMLTGVG